MAERSPDVDTVLRALSDPTRRALVEQVGRLEPVAVSRLAGLFPMSLAAVVQHVQVLEAAGLLATEKVGRTRWCRTDPAGLRVLRVWLDARVQPAARRLDALGAVLADDRPEPGAAVPAPTDRSDP